jgi:LacI family transcriptional regulator
MKKNVSMKDIAEDLGVSTTTVSYVLNDKHIGRINDTTAKKIKKHAKSLNYVPNHIAKSLQKGKTLTLGLIIADISNLFHSKITQIIKDEATKNNYEVIFGSTNEKILEFKKLIRFFISRQVDGLIMAVPPKANDSIEYLKEQQIPFVLIDRYYPEMSEVNFVAINNYKISYEVVKHFGKNSFNNPAMITINSDFFHMKERVRGFREAFKQELGNNEPQIIEIKEKNISKEVEAALLGLLKKGVVDSIYFSTNKIALEALAIFSEHKIDVPQEVGVICFDEAPDYRIFNTSITYVQQPLEKIGYTAVNNLISESTPKR